MKSNSTEEIIKTGLSSELEVPDHFSWEKMESGISRKSKKKRKFLYVWLTTGIFVLLALVWSFSSNEFSSQWKLTKYTYTTNIDVPIIDLKTKETISINKSIELDEDIEITTPQITTLYVAPSLYSYNATKNKLDRLKTNASLIDELDKGEYDLKEKMNIKVKLDTTLLDSKIHKLIRKESDVKTHITANKFLKEPSELEVILPNVVADERILNPTISTVPIQLNTLNNRRPWSLGLAIGINTVNQRASSNNSDYNKSLQSSFAQRIGASSEFNVGFEISYRLTLYSGLNYQAYRDQFYYTDISEKTTIEENVSTDVTVNLFTGTNITTFGTRTSKEVTTRFVSHVNKYIMYELPISIGYKILISNRIDIEGIGGLGFSRIRGQGLYINNQLDIIDLESTLFLNSTPIGISTNLGFRSLFKINSKWGVTAKVNNNYTLRKWIMNKNLNMRPSMWNLNLGIQMRL